MTDVTESEHSASEHSESEHSASEHSASEHSETQDAEAPAVAIRRRFVGRVAFVTGAAKGQGRSHALRLAQEGADLILLDVCADIPATRYAQGSAEQLAETVARAEAYGARVVSRIGDVRERAAVDAVVAEGLDRFGRLDVVLANAGIIQLKPVLELTDADWSDMLGINLTGVWHTVRAGLATMLEQGSGAIVMTSSAAGVKGPPNMAHYSAAKAGVLGLMRALANEVGPRGVRVNAVVPTTVDTDMVHWPEAYQLFRPDLAAPTREDVEPVFASLNVLPVPWIQPRDVTNAVLWLASDEARYVHGVALPVDAGTVIK